MDAVVVYPSGVVGPLDFGPSRMGQVFFNLRERAMPGLVAGGFDWVDVRDVVAGAMAAEASGRAGEGYILSGSYHSVPELAAMAAEISGVAAPRFVSPMWLARLGAPFMTLGNRVFGVEPLYTSEGLSALRGNPEISHAKAARELAYAPRPMLETIAALYRAHAQRELESHVACT